MLGRGPISTQSICGSPTPYVGTGVFTVVGQNAQLLKGFYLGVQVGTFSLTGQDAALYYGRYIQAVGAYLIQGYPATLTTTGGPRTAPKAVWVPYRTTVTLLPDEY